MANTRANQAATAADSKLQEFFEDQLQDIYWAEKKLVKTLPKMQEAATGNELKNAIGNHLEQTRTHAQMGCIGPLLLSRLTCIATVSWPALPKGSSNTASNAIKQTACFQFICCRVLTWLYNTHGRVENA